MGDGYYEYSRESFSYGDSAHEVIKYVRLEGPGELHRFTNADGVKCSAIYVNGYEQMRCPMMKERPMCIGWNFMHNGRWDRFRKIAKEIDDYTDRSWTLELNTAETER